MYAAIFKAVFDQVDEEYSQLAAEMRQLARDKYGCLDFFSICEGQYEVAISYWDNLEQIKQWKQAARHQQAQQKGRDKWYKSYSIEVTEILRAYQHTV